MHTFLAQTVAECFSKNLRHEIELVSEDNSTAEEISFLTANNNMCQPYCEREIFLSTRIIARERQWAISKQRPTKSCSLCCLKNMLLLHFLRRYHAFSFKNNQRTIRRKYKLSYTDVRLSIGINIL